MKTLIWSIVAILFFALVIFGVKQTMTPAGPGELDGFAQCLKDKGAVFYGAFWCPHCQNQKKMFGSSERLLPYVECSTADGRSQLAICREKNVTGYPTWEFSDGSRETGEVPLKTLGEKTGCLLPSDQSSGDALPNATSSAAGPATIVASTTPQ